ncbi:MAG: type IV pilus biogenesis/stability protein PilW [Rudaea sp.]
MQRRFALRNWFAPLAGALFCAVLSACTTQSGPALKETQTKEDIARPFIQLGQKYMEMGKLEIAKENLLKALTYDPKSVDAHTVLATLYDRVGDHQAAEENFRVAAELAPKAGSANSNYGLYLCKLGKFTESRKYFDIALADGFYADRATVYTNAGTCELLAKGSLDQAESDFRHALAIKPDDAQALFQLARVLYQKDDFFKARAFIQRFDALGQPSPDALLLARNIETKLGHAGAADDYAQRLRNQFPDSQQAHSLDAVTPPS